MIYYLNRTWHRDFARLISFNN